MHALGIQQPGDWYEAMAHYGMCSASGDCAVKWEDTCLHCSTGSCSEAADGEASVEAAQALSLRHGPHTVHVALVHDVLLAYGAIELHSPPHSICWICYGLHAYPVMRTLPACAHLAAALRSWS